MLDKTYEAASVEPRIYEAWEQAEAFKAGAGAEDGAATYSIVIPPPNVTGSLHMGHALNNTLQDIMVRYQRMRGRDVLWQPGMDHAGIATQMVVERQLAADGGNVTRRDMGREAFVERIWKWKGESGGMIFNQLKRLGASCDWSRERFTMDEGLSKAVLEVFVSLYKEDLIYKDKRLVNWDPKLLTAISDLEVEQKEMQGNMWHFRYPLADGTTYQHPVAFDEDGKATEFETRDYIVIATTRPETMLGDTAVIVHPDDERFKALQGKAIILPLVGRRVPIIADDYVDLETGTGAMKVTPAHDFNDFDIGKRHKLPQISIMDREANIVLREAEGFLDGLEMTAELTKTLDTLEGVERFKARKLIVSMLDELGLLDEVVEHTNMVPHGDRGGVPIEPMLTDQWYVDAKTMAKPAIASVREGRTKFVPANWDKTYYEWMNNIQPWCISRQLWWGHRIPAWYGLDGKFFVEKSEEEALAAASKFYGKPVKLMEQNDALAAHEAGASDFVAMYRDEDVLDTWFSSALWPFSTLGWPDKTSELARYYPTSVLVTGFDIIFFWVARMMMMGNHYMKTEPFDTVYIHALVRDEKGAKMSKSKGNVIDPLALIEEYSADALRFTLAAMAAQGRDIKLSTSRVAGYRNFATKLWNVCRFAEMNECHAVDGFDPALVKQTVNRWIVTETSRAIREVSEAIDTYRFNDAASGAYRFVWNTFCDWYVELTKPIFYADDEGAKEEVRATTAWARDEILKLLHPFMPFITEELWTRTVEDGENKREKLLALSSWPTPIGEDTDAAAEINWLIDLIIQIRSVRSEMNVPAGAKVPVVLCGASEQTKARLGLNEAAIIKNARAESVATADEIPQGSAQIVVGEATVCLPLAGVIDLDAEKARLGKSLDKIVGEVTKISKKLENERFLAKAPEDIVAAEKEKVAELSDRKVKVEAALERLAALG
ncbi:valine--tRNA ligase [Pseudovibrio sp. Tun.PSC04-5.I4]|uniref:valine--tRNA ligase n=1 Tax=Pseudovibrio sp. Tun.PSC04-5.I4 TaxID=1798213 RepID=UPI000890B4A6|nr:valine--tRNA ligase [Pseudovibrio sp. Tun.PSC04-5.I4]SDR09377.1 valyl-tRNA synthetase [Pseudovibrio sp. Tun.PSC04-5.I4]